MFHNVKFFRMSFRYHQTIAQGAEPCGVRRELPTRSVACLFVTFLCGASIRFFVSNQEIRYILSEFQLFLTAKPPPSCSEYRLNMYFVAKESLQDQ